MMQLRPALETSPVQEILARLDELEVMFRDSAAEGDRLARLPKYVVWAGDDSGPWQGTDFRCIIQRPRRQRLLE